MRFPADREAFSVLIEENNLFQLARKYLRGYLETYYEEYSEWFVEDFGADFETMMQTYRFQNTIVSLNKNFNFEPPMDTISCQIDISDIEDSYLTTYKIVFDYEMNVIDDMLYNHIKIKTHRETVD